MAEPLQGIIIQGIGGFYTVEAADAVYTCRARGLLRKQGITPLAGDRVLITPSGGGEGRLDEVMERRNRLIRPPVANLDALVIVASVAEPSPSTLVIDKMIALAVKNGIRAAVAVNKSDLQAAATLEEIYRRAGIDVFVLSAATGEGIAALKTYLCGKISAFTGNSGVGKSSLLNRILPQLALETGEISQKLGRGRHTTRATSLYRLEGGGYVADTPGFSSVELEKTDRMRKEELPGCFQEFIPYLGRCRFTSCSHVKEAGCAVRAAVEEGEIPPSRYDSYVTMYQEVKDVKEWER